jgi:glucose-6-phosphate 1-dehydrogenase
MIEEASSGPPAMRVRDPLTITIFGASGDLTQRKLLPALFAMQQHGLLPDEFCIVAFARRDFTDESFREAMAQAITQFSRLRAHPADIRRFCEHIRYHRGDIEQGQESFDHLFDRLQDTKTYPPNHLFYLSIKPDLFEPTLSRLKAARLIRAPFGRYWTRVVVEKPFGNDLASAVELNHAVRRHLDESQVYRIDHFLGKETVQNILSFRFANAIFEPLFNNHLVESIQITAAETVGMESGRGAYYDATGAVRDMVQNHLLQLLCLVTMEPPASMAADAIRNEKVKVLQSIVPPLPHEVAKCALRAQYAGYRDEERIDPASTTETFVALRLNLANWRWAGVPIYLRTGKRMPRRLTEIAVQFKVPPLQLFQTVECVGDVCDLTRSKPNTIIFRIQPDEGIALKFSAKRPVMQVQVENVAMNFSYSQTWRTDLPEAYERLLMDVMRGDSTLFTRSDEVEAAWRIVDPILKGWAAHPETPVHAYAPGSWGPEEADRLLTSEAQEWRKP